MLIFCCGSKSAGDSAPLELFAKVAFEHLSLLASNLGKRASANLGAIQASDTGDLEITHLKPEHLEKAMPLIKRSYDAA